MCGICGCDTVHEHHHEHEETILIEEAILANNQSHATHNREVFIKQGWTAINVMSSPGSGKTTLLGKTIEDIKDTRQMAVIVGDQQTDYDASALSAKGAQAIQINTGQVCHLDAHRVGHALETLDLPAKSLLFIENIGNLVCPALFDLGEHHRIVILSVTEGDNKPLKYPEMFRKADLLLLTKIDLLPYVPFDERLCLEYARRINPKMDIIRLSALTGEGVSQWYDWLSHR